MIKDLLERLPEIAQVDDPERFAKRNIMLFEEELNNKKSVFKHKGSDKKYARNRYAVIEIPLPLIGDIVAYEFGMDLIAYTGLCHRANKKTLSVKELAQKEILQTTLENRSGATPAIKEIENIMTIEEASGGVWWE